MAKAKKPKKIWSEDIKLSLHNKEQLARVFLAWHEAKTKGIVSRYMSHDTDSDDELLDEIELFFEELDSLVSDVQQEIDQLAERVGYRGLR